MVLSTLKLVVMTVFILHISCLMLFVLIIQSQAAARMMAVQYAGVGLPSYHVESRFLLLQATGDHR